MSDLEIDESDDVGGQNKADKGTEALTLSGQVFDPLSFFLFVMSELLQKKHQNKHSNLEELSIIRLSTESISSYIARFSLRPVFLYNCPNGYLARMVRTS